MHFFFFGPLWIFLKMNLFQKNSFRNTIRVSNKLDPEQADQSSNSVKIISRQQKSQLHVAQKELKGKENCSRQLFFSSSFYNYSSE